MDNIFVLTIQKYLDSKNIVTEGGDTWKQKDVSWESQVSSQERPEGTDTESATSFPTRHRHP